MQVRLIIVLFVVFFFNTILFAVNGIGLFSDTLFISVSSITCFVLVIFPKLIKEVLLNKKYLPFLLINILNLLYHLFFELGDMESLKYFLARLSVFSILSLHINYCNSYLKTYFFKHLYNFILVLGVVSLLFWPITFSTRYYGVFTNPNALGSIMSMGFAIKLLLYYEGRKKEILELFIFFCLVLLSGSRISLFALLLVYIFKFGISIRLIATTGISLIFLYFTLDFFGKESGANRLITQEIFSNRMLTFEYAFKTFKSKWLYGYGLSNYAYINNDLISAEHEGIDIGAHNGYLALLVQYGLLFAISFFIILFTSLFSIFTFVKSNWNSKHIQFFSFILIFTLLNCFVETMITGINDFQTCMFWLSFGYLYSEAFKWKKDLI
ncbi:MAG: hypothetical protein CMP66_01285 [Flavobacteriales bacterium]|nr:hypothetical protein [Flavobacteriales bacterium]